MSKQLVRLAVASVFALPLIAGAQTANVALYGRMNLDMEVVNGRQPNGSDPNVFRVSSNSTRFGIRGSESLGGGLSAIFQIENSVNADAGGGTLAGRDTFVGFQGAFGTFKLGRFHSPYDNINDIFGSATTLNTGILDTAAIWAQGAVGKDLGGFDERISNSVRYDTPTISGFSGTVHYGSGENDRHSGVLTNAAFYKNGPIQAGVAWQKNIKVRVDSKSPTVNLDDNAYSFTASYDFGIVKVAGVYERLDYDTATGDLTRNFYGVSGTAPVGKGKVYAFYGHGADGKGSAANGTRVAGLAKGPDSGADMYEISYTYPLSVRTSVYTGYVKIRNDANAAYNFGVNPYPTAIGGDPGGFVLGTFHNF